MSRAVPFILLVAALAAAADNVAAQTPAPEPRRMVDEAQRAAARLAMVTPSEGRERQSWPAVRRTGTKRPRPRRAVLVGALVGAVAGGAAMHAQYREGGSEAVWMGLYVGGTTGALVGWTASR